MAIFASFAAGYVSGSVPLGLLVGRRTRGVDIRRYGTGNIGASNTFRNLGVLPAAVVGVGSFAQGFVPAWLAGALTGSQRCRGAAAVGAVAGYGWSFLLHFRGGRAVGTATGALTAIWAPGLVPLLTLYAAGGLLGRPAPGVLAGMLSYLGCARLAARPRVLVGAADLIVAAVVARRLAGVGAELRGERPLAALLGRLIDDRPPGTRLVGPSD